MRQPEEPGTNRILRPFGGEEAGGEINSLEKASNGQPLPGLCGYPAAVAQPSASPALFAASTADKNVITLEKDGGELILIPSGEFEMGDGKDANCPRRRVFLDAYYIGKFAVTNAQYALFAKAARHRPPNNDFWNTQEKANHPVTNVSWDDAVAYAKWAGCDLPTEAQWEKAVRGPNGYLFPWGDHWDESKCCNSVGKKAGGPSSVDAYSEGMSGYGTYQQAGNVWEWCSDWYDEDYYKDPEAARNPEGPSEGSDRVLRGGSWESRSVVHFRGTSRFALEPFRRICDLGFRLARRA